IRVRIGSARSLRAFANWLSVSWTTALACMQALLRSEAAFLRTPKEEDHPSVVDALRSAKVETMLALMLWGAAVLVAVRGRATPLLLVLFVWQGTVYVTAPYLAWLNQRSKLTGPLAE